MRAAVLTLLIGVGFMAGLIGLFFWSPWASEGRAHERTWLSAVEDWRTAHHDLNGQACLRAFAVKVDAAPTDRMQPVARSIRSWCRGSTWYGVSNSLIDAHRQTASAIFEADFSRSASSISGVKARVHCWPEEDWAPLAEDVEVIGRDEFWLAGLADPPTRIDLSPAVCDPLRLFVRGEYTPYLNTQSYELAEAVVTLAHEAEHLRTPAASEAVVECHALQRARELVRQAGRRPWYQKEIADLAWQVGYPQQFADYRTKACRNGGPLDLHPGSNAWP